MFSNDSRKKSCKILLQNIRTEPNIGILFTIMNNFGEIDDMQTYIVAYEENAKIYYCEVTYDSHESAKLALCQTFITYKGQKIELELMEEFDASVNNLEEESLQSFRTPPEIVNFPSISSFSEERMEEIIHSDTGNYQSMQANQIFEMNQKKTKESNKNIKNSKISKNSISLILSKFQTEKYEQIFAYRHKTDNLEFNRSSKKRSIK